MKLPGTSHDGLRNSLRFGFNCLCTFDPFAKILLMRTRQSVEKCKSRWLVSQTLNQFRAKLYGRIIHLHTYLYRLPFAFSKVLPDGCIQRHDKIATAHWNQCGLFESKCVKPSFHPE